MKNKSSNVKGAPAVAVQRGVRQIGQFDGWSGTKRRILQFTEPTNAVCSHSCLIPKFSITFRVAELRKILKRLRADDCITATVGENQCAEFTFIR